ncbi:MAG: hypothetical protein HY594_02505 [Candidatus Omnitrophica bacterium]|nr:hypothetical protein [Candidatus Omnitrophota bacterium]
MTPEERLFRTIGEKPGGEQTPASAVSPISKLLLLIPRQWTRLLNASELRRWFMDRPIQRINLILACLLSFLLVSLIFDVATAPRRFRKFMEIPAGSTASLDQSPSVSAGPSLEEYASVLSDRNVFQVPNAAGQSPASSPAAAVSPVEGLKLVGIAWSDEPEAIINDIKANKTFFLKAGNRVGALTVREVTREAVILVTDSGEVHELR